MEPRKILRLSVPISNSRAGMAFRICSQIVRYTPPTATAVRTNLGYGVDMNKPIYLDYNATTPVDPAVVDAMEPYLREHFGNPSSDHYYGYQTNSAVQTAREKLAALLGVKPGEVIFT